MVSALDSGKIATSHRVNGESRELCNVAFACRGSRGTPLRTTYAIGVVSYALRDAESAAGGSPPLPILLYMRFRLSGFCIESASRGAYYRLIPAEQAAEVAFYMVSLVGCCNLLCCRKGANE